MATETIDPIVRPKVLIDTKLEPPKMYNVYILDDDTTTFDFVIETLTSIFHIAEDAAEAITMAVHTEGRGLAGTFPHEIAETKVYEALQLADSAGHPLRTTAEEE